MEALAAESLEDQIRKKKEKAMMELKMDEEDETVSMFILPSQISPSTS